MLVDLSGNEAPVVDSDPSVTRAANFLYESMRVGPEETSLHYLTLNYKERKQILSDLSEMMMFMRELWGALSQTHLGLTTPEDQEQDTEINGSR